MSQPTKKTHLRTITNETSVKSIAVLSEATPTDAGICDFVYRDQYSVFDWGTMPMPDGATMDNRPVAVVAAFNYELLRKLGVRTAFLGTVGNDGEAHTLEDLFTKGEIPRALRMRMVNRIKPRFANGSWDYSIFDSPTVNNYIIPLEFIWRGEAGPDSSFWKNIENGSYALQHFGLPSTLKKGDRLPRPILDHSSKYEDHDRYFPPETARFLSSIDPQRWQELNATRQAINMALSTHAAQAGIHRPDGKQEFCVITENGKSEIYLADVAGTWHEDRFEYTTGDGRKVKVSKQTPRDLNKLLNPQWAQQCTELKERAEKDGFTNWRQRVTVRPEPLEAEFFRQYNTLMYAATNAWVGRNVFPAPDLETACKEFDRYLADYKRRLGA